MDSTPPDDPRPRPSATRTRPLRELTLERQRQVMARLWSRMAAVYGESRWLAHAPHAEQQEGDKEPPRSVQDEWRSILAWRSVDDIARGVARFESSPGRHPPGAGEFRQACAEWQPGTFAGNAQPRSTEPLPALGHLASRTRTGRKWLALMYLDKHLPWPKGLKMETLEDALDGCDVAAMREQVVQGREAIYREHRAQWGIHKAPEMRGTHGT